MAKRWIVTILILIIVSFLIWAEAKEGFAAKDTRFYSMKMLTKLDKVLENQQLIVKELRELKERIKVSQ